MKRALLCAFLYANALESTNLERAQTSISNVKSYALNRCVENMDSYGMLVCILDRIRRHNRSRKRCIVHCHNKNGSGKEECHTAIQSVGFYVRNECLRSLAHLHTKRRRGELFSLQTSNPFLLFGDELLCEVVRDSHLLLLYY